MSWVALFRAMSSAIATQEWTGISSQHQTAATSVRRAIGRRPEALVEAIAEVVDTVTAGDAQDWFWTLRLPPVEPTVMMNAVDGFLSLYRRRQQYI